MTSIAKNLAIKTTKKMTTFVEKNQHFYNNSDVSKGISLCIPHLFNNISYKRVKQVFIQQNWGFVERVDLIHYGDHKKAFIHFRKGSWNYNKRNQQFLTQLQKGNQIHLNYENGKPWFWNVGISYVERPKPEDVDYYPLTSSQNKGLDDELLKIKNQNQTKAKSLNTDALLLKPDNRRNDPILARVLENTGSPTNYISNTADSYDPQIEDVFA